MPPRPGEQHPARAARERLRGPHELAPPGGDAPEVLFEDRADIVGDLVALAAEVPEVQLVQRHRAHGDQLFALEGAEPGAGSFRIESGQLGPNSVQGSHGAAVVVLVMADEHPLRDAVQRPGPDRDRNDLLVHDLHPLFDVWVADGRVCEGRDHGASSAYTAARCVAGRSAHTTLRAASNASVWAPGSVVTVSR